MLLLAAVLVALLAATVQSAAGFGFALILGPVLFAILDRETALATLLILGGTLNILVLFGERRRRQIRWRELARFLIAAAPGLIAGGLILHAVAKPTIQLAVGVAVLGAVGLQVRYRSPAAAVSPAAGSQRGPIAVGAVTGLLTTTTGTNGPPMLLWLQRRAANPRELRDTITAASLSLTVLGTATLLLLGQGPQDPRVTWTIPLLAATAAGHQAGHRIFDRLAADQFRIVGLALCAITGIASIVAAIATR
jgi:hypothetical protein